MNETHLVLSKRVDAEGWKVESSWRCRRQAEDEAEKLAADDAAELEALRPREGVRVVVGKRHRHAPLTWTVERMNANPMWTALRQYTAWSLPIQGDAITALGELARGDLQPQQ